MCVCVCVSVYVCVYVHVHACGTFDEIFCAGAKQDVGSGMTDSGKAAKKVWEKFTGSAFISD